MAGMLTGPYSGGSNTQDEEIPIFFEMDFFCVRNKNHKLRFYFLEYNDIVIKIGEYPSKVDRYKSELRQYKKELLGDFDEYKKSILLFNHGFGIGAYVYLRRVFERIIEKSASRKYDGDNSWTIEKWKKEKKRMDFKIEDLKDNLPDFLVKNKTIHSILSKGIHELDEEECLDHFPIVNAAIVEILDDWINLSEKEQRRSLLSNQLNDILSKIL